MASHEASMEEILATIPDEDHKTSMKRLLYGKAVDTLPISEEATAMARNHNFDVVAYKTPFASTQDNPPRMCRIGVIQHGIVEATTEPIAVQYKAIEQRVELLLDAAAAMGCNVVSLQEAWSMPFFFCTREKRPWLDFATPAEHGPVFDCIAAKAKQHNMVIVSPILERDASHQHQIWNTAVIVGNDGQYLGKHRKNHIPRVGDFNESTYYMEGNTGHPVFETPFGKVAVNICYGRHHPLNWMMFALNGAEIVFNPSATVGALSEPMWPVEARCASIANNYFVGAINRVGTENFPHEFTSGDGKPAHHDFGHFYGSSYIANPDGSRTPGLGRNKDGVLVNEVDLNMCTAVKDVWMFQHTARYDMYAQGLADYGRPDFEPQVVTKD